nr:cation:proton antiporter [Pseudomonadota bacterium]
GLTFGSISALYGLTHHIVDKAQYSYLIAAVVASAVVPTMIANAFFMPRHLLPKDEVVGSTGTVSPTESPS